MNLRNINFLPIRQKLWLLATNAYDYQTRYDLFDPLAVWYDKTICNVVLSSVVICDTQFHKMVDFLVAKMFPDSLPS